MHIRIAYKSPPLQCVVRLARSSQYMWRRRPVKHANHVARFHSPEGKPKSPIRGQEQLPIAENAKIEVEMQFKINVDGKVGSFCIREFDI